MLPLHDDSRQAGCLILKRSPVRHRAGSRNTEPTKPLGSRRDPLLLTSSGVEKDAVPVSERPRAPRNRCGELCVLSVRAQTRSACLPENIGLCVVLVFRGGRKSEEPGPDGGLTAISEKEAAGQPTEVSSASPMHVDAGQQSVAGLGFRFCRGCVRSWLRICAQIMLEPGRHTKGAKGYNSLIAVADLAGQNREVVNAAGGTPEPEMYAPHSTTKARVKALKVKERHIAGQNMLKFHLRPPARQGCFDDGERQKGPSAFSSCWAWRRAWAKW